MAGCAGLHVVAAEAEASGVRVLLLLAMALACVPCATHTLLAPTWTTWVRAGSVSVGMLVVHPLLNLADAGHAHHSGASAPAILGVGMVVGPLVAACLAGIGAIAAGRDSGGADRRRDRPCPASVHRPGQHHARRR